MKMWGGRFTGEADPDAWRLNASLETDKRMAREDVEGSLAWAGALHEAGLLSAEEEAALKDGMERISEEFGTGSFAFQGSDEDIHTAVERRLSEIAGPAAGKLHTGRSRNDQVATDFRLWLLKRLPTLDAAVRGLQETLLERAEAGIGILMPGYTHLQRAQPIHLTHWWLAHFWPLARDRQRLAELRERTAWLPLGSGALAGTPFPVDRHALAEKLGFERPAPNSIDAVSDRDFAAEFLFWAALLGVHLSRLAEGVIVFSSAEFGFFELDDAFASGSSLMPQKKNPDVFELARGQAGTLLGKLTGLLATLKGLPSAYDKDLQEDKAPVFAAYDTIRTLLPALTGAVRTLKVRPEKMREAITPELLATDLADYLVEMGIPFREAHLLAGQAVKTALREGKSLAELSQDEWREVHPDIGEEVQAVFDPAASTARRRAYGGTAEEALRVQLREARENMEISTSWREVKR
jgi:argininosuccinate lyase